MEVVYDMCQYESLDINIFREEKAIFYDKYKEEDLEGAVHFIKEIIINKG